MIGTEFLKGQGLGNQLFCYVSARCIAKDLGYEFGTAGQKELAVNIHSQKGMYFMDMDLGKSIDNPEAYTRYDEKEVRLYVNNSVHDLLHGCYVAGDDKDIYKISDNTLLYGNLQAASYVEKHREEICQWLKVKPEYDDKSYSKENLCVINFRGGEYADSHELFLREKYYRDAISIMKKERSDMEFVVVTDDVEGAQKILPELKCVHGALHEDYTAVKNAYYLILSNSSFAFFPAFTSQTVKKIIAPKYWARHNVSNGYWASEQNIYEGFEYLDRKGNIYSASECKKELEEYKSSKKYQSLLKKTPADGIAIKIQKIKDSAYYYVPRIARKIKRSIQRNA